MARNWINRTNAMYNQRSGPGQFNQRITVPEIEDENDYNCYDNTAYDDISWSDDECPDADYAITSSDSEDDVPETKDVHHVNGNVPHARITKVQIEKRKSWEPNEDMKPTRKTSKSKNNQWNVFAETSSELGTHSERRRWRTINVVVKIVLCTIFFFIVLGTATLSKLTFLYMTFYINPGEGFSFKHQDGNNENKTFHYELKKPVPNHTMDIKWIWAIIMILCSQYLFTVIFSLWTIIFKKTVPIKCLALIMTLVTETLHTVGLSIFIFYILPSFDPLTACLLTWNVAAIPGILKIFLPDIPSTASLTPDTKMSTESKTTTKSCCRKIIDVIMAVLHLGSMAAWVYQSYYDRDIYVMVLLPVSLTLISLSWWENFIALPKKKRGPDYDPKESGNGCFSSIKDSLGKRNVKTIFIATVWKILLTIGFPALFFSYSKIECVETFFFLRKLGTNCSVFGNIKLMDDRPPIYGTDCHNMMPFLVACVNIVSSVICYKTGKSACKILAQVPCFTLPIMLSGPLSVAILLSTYTFPEEIPIFMGCSAPWVDIGASSIGDFLFHFTVEWWIPVGLVGYVSMLYIVGHTFSPKSDRLARTDRLFIKPLFCGVLLEQSMLLNRRRDEDDGRKHKLKGKWTLGDPDTKETDEPKGEKKDEVPMIYICATMWHETEQEMINMLKSVFRLDSDQSARKLAQSFFGLTDPDYYEFEAHIFFDDAFQAHDDTCVDFRVNDFVKQLVRVMQKAASDIHGGAMEIQSPVKVATPYGGRLTWNMPGGNKIIAHVKDKAKIRHRKRWSQVMYMYYFLGYQLLSKKMSMKRKKMRAENTYLLALDGDVDFQPMAVQILVDRMKTNPNLGAACGRIHPIGSGPMVWYQKFEYAVSHWLAKATEHMLGCVLCSPGCFSLFRGSALMDDNVMKKYTTPPTEARHYVQYDQGEDRWLCTLLLQQGYRVEYAAASDSYTFAPEGFYEFYNQRRRWTPSTMANILDLLMTWTATTKKNEDISWLYMFYQTSLLTFSIITPGTIFLLVLGALRTAYADIPLYGALILNLIPVCIFVFLCLKAPSKYQLAFAGILSIFYSLLMMLVLVGLIKQVGDYGFCSVTTIFMTTVASIFVVAAFLHPQEFTCILHGFLYFLTIPSMSMLLVIYSLANLHNVSWGTREVKQAAPPPKQQDNTAPPVKHNMLHQFVGKVVDSHNLESDFGFRCGNMFTCACCPSENSSRSTMDKVILARLDELDEKITVLASVDGSIRDVSDLPTDSSQPPPFSKDPNPFEGAGERENPVFEEEIMKVKENSHSPFWIKDDDLGDGDITMSTTDEDSFWEELISLYLFPLVENKDHKKKIQTELIELRNKVCLAFLLINALFIILIYALETISESSENLSFKIPCDIPNFEGERVEPISMTFTLVFGVMLSLQFTAMLFHRFSTFLHIASITNLQIKTGMSKKSDQPSPVTVEETIDLVREMQTVARDEDTMSVVTVSGNSTDSNPVGKELWHKLAVRRKPSIAPKTLSRAFMKNYGKLVNHLQNDEINDVTEQDRTQQLQKKFKRFERKSLATIVKMAQASPDVKQQIISRGKKRWDMLREKVKGKQGMSDVVSRVLQQKKLEHEQANKDSFMHIPDTQNDAGVHPLILLARKHKEMEQQKAKQEAGIAEESEPDDQTETSIHIEAAVSTPVSVRSRRQQNGEEAGIAEESEPDDQTETSVIHIEAAVSTPVSVRSRRQQNGELPPPSLRLPRDNVV